MNKILLLILLLIITKASFGDEFKFSADRVQTIFAKGKERTHLSGNAQIVSSDNFIEADEIELYGEDFIYALCRGNVHLINTEKGLEITCDKLFYDRTLKIARMQGNAVMIDRENEIVVKGGFIENREETEVTIIQIGVRILKEDMACRSEFARYLRNEDILELSGMPIVYWKGDEYRAAKIYIDLEKDEIILEGDVQGEILESESEAETENE